MNIKRVYIWINVIIDYIRSFLPIQGEIYNSEDTIDCIIKSKRSLIRLGDGEFKILEGGDVHYQEYNEMLKEELKKIIQEYNSSSMYLLCVPYKYFTNSNLVLNRRVLISCWSTPKRIFKKMVKQECIYGDAFVFAKDNNEKSKRIWEDFENIVLVHNDEEYMKDAYDLVKQRGYFVKSPKRNAYGVVDELEKNIIDICECNYLNKNQTIVLISAGPAAKALVYRLASQGYVAIDCGHMWDNPLEV